MKVSIIDFLLHLNTGIGTFESVFTERSSPRVEGQYPKELPQPFRLTNNSLKESKQPINDLQKTYVRLVSILNNDPLNTVDKLKTERDGVSYYIDIKI